MLPSLPQSNLYKDGSISYDLSTLGISLCAMGKPQAAIPICNRALRVDPLESSHTYLVLGYAYELMKRYEEAI